MGKKCSRRAFHKIKLFRETQKQVSQISTIGNLLYEPTKRLEACLGLFPKRLYHEKHIPSGSRQLPLSLHSENSAVLCVL
jgi:hypothetical protein